MNEQKSGLLFRVVCMLAEFVGVLLICVYMYTAAYSKKDNAYNAVLDISSQQSEALFEADGALSSKASSDKALKSSSYQAKIKEPSSHSQISLAQNESKVKPVSSKAVSSKPVSSKAVSSKEEIPCESNDLPAVASSAPQSIILPFESEAPSHEEIDNTQNEANQKKLLQLSQKYAVAMTVPTLQSNEFSEYIASYAKNSTDVTNAIAVIEAVLKNFPQDFFSQAATNVSFFIVAQTKTEDIIAYETAIIIPCIKTLSGKLIEKLIIDIAYKQLEVQLSLDYTTCNPDGFLYGNVIEKYNYSPQNYAYAYFLSSAAQQSQQADLYAVFMAVFEKPQTLKAVKPASPLYLKLKYTFEQLASLSPCFGKIRVISEFL